VIISIITSGALPGLGSSNLTSKYSQRCRARGPGATMVGLLGGLSHLVSFTEEHNPPIPPSSYRHVERFVRRPQPGRPPRPFVRFVVRCTTEGMGCANGIWIRCLASRRDPEHSEIKGQPINDKPRLCRTKGSLTERSRPQCVNPHASRSAGSMHYTPPLCLEPLNAYKCEPNWA